MLSVGTVKWHSIFESYTYNRQIPFLNHLHFMRDLPINYQLSMWRSISIPRYRRNLANVNAFDDGRCGSSPSMHSALKEPECFTEVTRGNSNNKGIAWLVGSVFLCHRWQLRYLVFTTFSMPGTACDICADSKQQHIFSFSQCGSNIRSPRPEMWQTPLKNNVLWKTQELYGSHYNVVAKKIRWSSNSIGLMNRLNMTCHHHNVDLAKVSLGKGAPGLFTNILLYWTYVYMIFDANIFVVSNTYGQFK